MPIRVPREDPNNDPNPFERDIDSVRDNLRQESALPYAFSNEVAPKTDIEKRDWCRKNNQKKYKGIPYYGADFAGWASNIHGVVNATNRLVISDNTGTTYINGANQYNGNIG